MRKNTKEIDRATIMFLDKLLPPVSEDAMAFLKHPFKHSMCSAKAGKRAEKNEIYWCDDCGAEFSRSEIKDYHKRPNGKDYWYDHEGTCPHCGKPIFISDWARKVQRFEDIVAVKARMGKWGIERYFAVNTMSTPGKPAEVLVSSIGATWTKGENSYHYIARKGGMFYSKFWRPATRHFASDSPYAEERYKRTEIYKVPKFSLDAELAKRGIKVGELHGLKLSWLIDTMDNTPAFETLWKAGEWEIAKFFKSRVNEYWAQIKIVRRHGYKIADLREWRDMIDLLRRLRIDDHNPKFICPDNLHDAHNALVAESDRRYRIMRERWRREDDERAREEARVAMLNREEQNKDYIKRREKYFGINIPSNAGFTIVVLRNIDEFEREGDTLHHCVFRCGYYKKSNSLILSARDSENNPIETIELDLRSYKILQCYGVHDTHTKLHNKIVQTMQENIWRVKDAGKGQAKVAC